MSILPRLDTPVTLIKRRGSSQLAAQDFDAIVVVAHSKSIGDAFASLPDTQSWQRLHSREPARTATVRVGALSSEADVVAVIGYLATDPAPFAQLALAGRLMNEIAARKPKRLGIAVVGFGAAERALTESLLAAAYAHAFAMPDFRTAKTAAPHSIQRVEILHATKADLERTRIVARGTNLVRWLTALPPNKLDAASYRRAIASLARTHGLQMRWLDESKLARLGAGAFLAVSAGNAARDAGIAHLSYRPRKKRGSKTSTARATKPDVAFVGKGILFDTGGNNLKPHRSMLDMHTDMSGSAVALASLIALAEARAPIAADAWLAISENRIGPTAYKPQDVVTAANGTTIQVIHTDAEGRMALADTLALAGRTQPRFMFDFATLTGVCEYSLTDRMSGVFTNRQSLAPKLVQAGVDSGERVWNFPMDEDYDTDIESRIADVAQCAVDSKGDHIHASRFLLRFVPESVPWVHVDLSSALRPSGLAHVPGPVTGFGVRYALNVLLDTTILRDAVTA